MTTTLDDACCTVNLDGEMVYGFRDDRHLLASLFPVSLLDGFAHARQRLDAVARVETGCLNHGRRGKPCSLVMARSV